MHTVIFILVLAVAFGAGTFGFCEIIGSFHKGKCTLLRVIVWAAILFALFFLTWRFLYDKVLALVIGYVAALLLAISKARNEN